MLALVVSTQATLIVRVAFEIRQDYVVKHLCVNRGNPNVECNGKCYLTKKVKEAHHDHHESDSKAPLIELPSSMLVIALPPSTTDVPPRGRPVRLSFPRDATNVPSGISSDVFRPPRAA